ncbi:translation initiation factor 1A [Plasmodium inui San Antonio 1]|uniref:Translation initiation factor 1A n=1 Tax=Plasmodium inui San Antonio 1 TaxID=1237626 RepID=W7A663_9APIC|nr:translation initiation factor 1A [Plasmodium inui San Antonio 1]EUD67280.1 translation initiation factor 1A [Plasmodium inui San Antonio 1]
MRKRVWINSGDIILVSLRDYQDSKADVIAKYTPDEARSLKTHGELPETAKINETDIFDDDAQNGVEFLDDESDEEAQEEVNNAKKLEIEDVSGGIDSRGGEGHTPSHIHDDARVRMCIRMCVCIFVFT